MSLQKLLTGLAILTWAAVALTAAPSPRSHRQESTVSMQEDGPVRECSDLHVRMDSHEAVMQSEQRTITRAEAANLRVRGSSNGGVQVEGGSSDSYSVTLCKFARPGSGAESLLSQVHLSFGQLASLLIRSPRALAAENPFLRKQLALFQQRQVKSHRTSDATRWGHDHLEPIYLGTFPVASFLDRYGRGPQKPRPHRNGSR